MRTFLIALLLFAVEAGAATRYVATTGTNTDCETIKNIANPAQTIAYGLSCTQSGDTLILRGGTYAEGIVATQIANGTPSAYTTIQAYQTEVVTIQPTGSAGTLNFGSTGQTHQYIRVQGDLTAKNLVLDAINTTATTSLQFGAGSNGGVVQYIEVKGFEAKRSGGPVHTTVGLGGNGVGEHITLSHCSIHDNTGGVTEHAVYLSSGNNLVEFCEIYNITGYPIHQYSGATSNNVYRYNWVHHFGLNSGTSTGILIWGDSGSGNQVYGNLVTDGRSTGSDGSTGIRVYLNNTSVYNNTVHSMEWRGIHIAAGSNSEIKNNIITSAGGAVDQLLDAGTNTVKANNFCSLAHANCALNGNPLYVDSAGGNYALTASSPAIDQGTTTGIPRNYQGSNPDIGAFETVTFNSCSASGTTLTVLFNNVLASPMIYPNVTGTTIVIDGDGGRTLGTPQVTGNSIAISFTGNPAGSTATYAYTTTGSVSDSSLIGGSKNQRLNAVTTQSCNVTGGGGAVLAQAYGQFRQLRSSSKTTPESTRYALAAENANATVQPGAVFALRLKVTCATADCLPTASSLQYSKNGGGYLNVPDSFGGDGIKFFGTSNTSADIPAQAMATTQQLTTANPFVAGLVVRNSSAIPSFDLDLNGSIELEYLLEIAPSVAVGATFDFRLTGLTSHSVTPQVAVISSFCRSC